MGKLSYITSDPIADWNRYCAEQDEAEHEKVICDICGEEFEKDGYGRVCPACSEDIREEIRTIYNNYMRWGADETALIEELFDAVEAL